MSKTIEQEFCEVFDISNSSLITDSKILELENILFNNVFYDGIHIHNPECVNDYWCYALTYRIGGYYNRGAGKTRLEALLNQFVVIMKDNYTIEKQDKDIIYNEVRKLMGVKMSKNKYLVVVDCDCCDGKCSGCYSAGKNFFELENLEQVVLKTIECKKREQSYKIYKQINVLIAEQNLKED